jgi:hypothetical protein
VKRGMGEGENTGSTQDLKQFERRNTGKAKTGQYLTYIIK